MQDILNRDAALVRDSTGEKKPFPEGHGSAHGPDEAQNIQEIIAGAKA